MDLSEILREGTRGVEQCYFRLNIHGGDPVFRERVYCYELYHQMRLRWTPECPFVLNGEVDKRAHPILAELGADFAKPDFLVHTPGRMEGNHAIIEVKHSLETRGVRKDLSTLSTFVERVGYERAIYLVFGHDGTEAVDRIAAIAADFDYLKPIEVWLHAKAREEAGHLTTIERRQ